MISTIQNFIERNAFGVCTRIGEKVGISSEVIRMYFIYASFFTFGSPIIIYMALAFWLNLKCYLRRGTRVKELL